MIDASSFTFRLLELALASRAGIAASLTSLVVLSLVLAPSSWAILAAVLLLDLIPPLRRVASTLAALVLLTASGALVLLSAPSVPFFKDPREFVVTPWLAVGGLALGLILAASAQLVGPQRSPRVEPPVFSTQALAALRLTTGLAGSCLLWPEGKGRGLLAFLKGPEGVIAPDSLVFPGLALAYLGVMAASSRWPKASAAVAAVGSAFMALGSSAFLFFMALGQAMSGRIDSGATRRILLVLLLHWAILPAAVWCFAIHWKGPSARGE